MFEGITPGRAAAMSAAEQGWLANIKSSFHASDVATIDGNYQRAFAELFKAIDTMITLRCSLRGESRSSRHNKRRFVKFMQLVAPDKDQSEPNVSLRDEVSEYVFELPFGLILYDIRCMLLHASENVDAPEKCGYHVLLDWNLPVDDDIFGTVHDLRITLNGKKFYARVRGIVARFMTAVDCYYGSMQETTRSRTNLDRRSQS